MCIRTRFNQKDFKVYESIQELLLKAVAGEDYDEELAKVMAVYGDTDLQQYKLEAQLSLLPEVVQAMGYDTFRFDIADLLDFFQSLGNARKLLLSEICTLGKLMLFMPATNAVSERSFFALKRVKTYQCVQPRKRAGSTTSCFCMSTRNWQMVLTWWRSPICLWGTTSGASNCLGSFQKTTCRWSLRLPLRQLRQFNNYELTKKTLKGETFAGFKIQR